MRRDACGVNKKIYGAWRKKYYYNNILKPIIYIQVSFKFKLNWNKYTHTIRSELNLKLSGVNLAYIIQSILKFQLLVKMYA